MSSMFVNQGNVMQRQLVWNGSVMRVPSASMAVFNTVSIIVLVGEVEVWVWVCCVGVEALVLSILAHITHAVR